MNLKTVGWAAMAVIFMILGVMIGIRQLGPATAPSLAAEQLFSTQLPDVQGKPQSLSQWRGKAMVVNFWATWCAPCVEEMPELSAAYADWASQGVQLIGIGIDDPDQIKAFAEKYRIAFPLYTAGVDGIELTRQFGNRVGGLPFTVLIGKDGVVKQSYSGRLNIKSLQADVARIISEPD